MSYLALQHYSPALVILLGALTFAGVAGCGEALSRVLRLTPPSPWREVQSTLLGMLAYGSVIQIVATAGLAERGILTGVWLATVAAGTSVLIRRAVTARRKQFEWPGGVAALLLGLGALAASINLLLAASPSTKADEIFYHMLLPARIVADGQLSVYLQPWPAAILPQMGVQIASAPLFAMGQPDAPNVMAWCASLLLAWFVYRVIDERTGSRVASLAAAAAIQVGVYPSVWYTTGGAHAFGALGLVAAVVGLLLSDELLPRTGGVAHVATISILAVSAAGTKISLLPLSAVVVAVAIVQALRADEPASPARSLAAAALPWLVFYAPLALWTWQRTGSPFGPVAAGAFGPSVFGGFIAGEMEASRVMSRHAFLVPLRTFLVSQSPLIWLGAPAFLLLPGRRAVARWLAGGLLTLQLALIVLFLPLDLRFLGGLPVAMMTAAAVSARPYVHRPLRDRPRAASTLLVLLLAPWLALQAWRAAPLLRPALGMESAEDYARRYVPLYEDLVRLDRLLPAGVGLVTHSRIGTVYAPRPIYLDVRDAPPAARLFVLMVSRDGAIDPTDCAAFRLPADCELGPVVYENPRAHLTRYRLPGREEPTATLQVRELIGGSREAAPARKAPVNPGQPG